MYSYEFVEEEKFDKLLNKVKKEILDYKNNNILDIYEVRELTILYNDYELIESYANKGIKSIYDYNKLEEINKRLKVYKKQHKQNMELKTELIG